MGVVEAREKPSDEKRRKDVLAFDPFSGDMGDVDDRKLRGNLVAYRFCRACCDAMALSWTDQGEALTHRNSLRPGGDS